MPNVVRTFLVIGRCSEERREIAFSQVGRLSSEDGRTSFRDGSLSFPSLLKESQNQKSLENGFNEGRASYA